MKKFVLVPFVFVVLSLVFCDNNSSRTVCDDARDVVNAAMVMACVDQVCPVCACFHADMTFDGTDCVDDSNKCSGSAVAEANLCLADETACASAIVASVDATCADNYLH